jgi:hypothetical protein
MGEGEIFNEVLDLYKRHFFTLVGTAAVAYLPGFLLDTLAPDGTTLDDVNSFVMLAGAVLAHGAVVKLLAERALGRKISVAGAWVYFLRRSFPLLLTLLLAYLLQAIATALFVLPGIAVLFWLYFLWGVMAVEGRFYLRAIFRSRELAKGRWRRILVNSLLTILLVLAVGTLSLLVFAVGSGLLDELGRQVKPTGASDPLWLSLLEAALLAGWFSIVAPLFGLPSLLLYLDTRVRKEGLDIELLAQQMSEMQPDAYPTFDLS